MELFLSQTSGWLFEKHMQYCSIATICLRFSAKLNKLGNEIASQSCSLRKRCLYGILWLCEACEEKVFFASGAIDQCLFSWLRSHYCKRARKLIDASYSA